MLELKKISKDYKVGNGTFRALNEVSLKFRKGEFVAILGHSGCGKTTALNIIGGLDRYTEGDLVINGTSTKSFSEKDWDAYRNNSVGFVFQSYNLINHLSVLDNVELGMTLSGVNKTERRIRAEEVLERVGLKLHMNKKPTLLSGGEKQRVAIARALVNNPDIMLADEPTGALDSKTAREILDLIKEISKDKLVIMVTHEAKYAEEYASRTIKLLDGEIIEDNDEYTGVEEDEGGYLPNKTSMSFLTALKLSFNNLKTKKFRTTITALASSIGIIGVGLVLSISNGFSGILDDLESDQLVGLPIMITEGEAMFGPPVQIDTSDPASSVEGQITVYDPDDYSHVNIITEDFVTYLDTLEDDVYTTIQYNYGYQPQLLMENDGVSTTVNKWDMNFSSYITPEDELEDYYEIISGHFPQSPFEVTLLVKDGQVVDKSVIETLGFDPDSTILYTDIIGTHIYVAKNNDYFNKDTSSGLFIPQFAHLDTVLDNGIELTITGIVQMIDDTISIGGDNGIYYLYSLEQELLNINMASDICIDQTASSVSVLTGETLTIQEKFDSESFLGCNDTVPRMVNIYTDSIDHKDTIKSFISDYNVGLLEEDQIQELDLAATIGSTMGTIISMISIVLSSFASISLVVSSVMIGIIIYISVLERTKEIGIIRSLGGRKKDVSRVFNAESVIIGAFAGLLGVTITYLLTFPINLIVANFEETLTGVAQVNVLHLVALVLISTILTFLGGFIPSRMASKKNPVEALRVE